MRGVGDPFVVLREALALLMVLPAEPPQTLARFAAARCGGDPHALDRDRPLDAVLRRALAALDAEPGADTAGAEARRARYDRWGLGCDELSSTVLCAGLRPCEVGSPLSAALRASASGGEPRVVTLRELRGIELLACGPIVWTCENPDVVAAAADALGTCLPAADLHGRLAVNGVPAARSVRSAPRELSFVTTVTSTSRGCGFSTVCSA